MALNNEHDAFVTRREGWGWWGGGRGGSRVGEGGGIIRDGGSVWSYNGSRRLDKIVQLAALQMYSVGTAYLTSVNLLVIDIITCPYYS